MRAAVECRGPDERSRQQLPEPMVAAQGAGTRRHGTARRDRACAGKAWRGRRASQHPVGRACRARRTAAAGPGRHPARRRAARADAHRRGRAVAAVRLHPFRGPRGDARGEERRAEEALHRPALQCHGRPGHLHRRLRQARSPAGRHAAQDGAVAGAGAVRRREEARRRLQLATCPWCGLDAPGPTRGGAAGRAAPSLHRRR